MPEPFTQLTSRTFVLTADNIDTDQIIPARFLTTTSRAGLGAHAFYDWRYDHAGAAITGAPLNSVDTATHRVLVAGANFGCGSSREHAPWALLDFGFRVVISSSFADIFHSNALKNGLLPVSVDLRTHGQLLAGPGMRVSIDLERAELRIEDAAPVRFPIEAFARRCLLEGVDTMDWLLARMPAIHAFERGAAS
ncbi:MAG: 3-isopropylmalate dehydratase small subunit [Phycisphaerales bacterium]|nr:3-isopropylmalate dehydratase small subunit [Hyphomonadaceae bacterium]